MTQWPSVPLFAGDGGPPDRVRAYARTGQTLVWDGSTYRKDAAPLHELYLRVAELDETDDAAVDHFVAHYGVMGLLAMVPTQAPGVEDASNEDFAYHGLNSEDFRGLRDGLFEERMRLHPSLGAYGWMETMSEFRVAVRLVRDLVAAWRWVSEENRPVKSWSSPLFDNPVERNLAAGLLSLYLSEILRYLHPAVFISFDGDPPELPTDMPSVVLCCVQLFNAMLEGPTYRTCQNERCGRTFTRQYGRAGYGQHRTRGKLLYCTDTCARAQAQRLSRPVEEWTTLAG